MSENVGKIDQDLINGWSRQYGRPVSAAEVQEITGNLSNFFSILLRWEKQFQEKGLLDELVNIRNPNRSR